ncbi:MAG TPA: hypothetical protein VJT73_07955 [Polyangiaceae bacterium]|nr:hypothetical protein [Polyangiaceae bacterium]
MRVTLLRLSALTSAILVVTACGNGKTSLGEGPNRDGATGRDDAGGTGTVDSSSPDGSLVGDSGGALQADVIDGATRDMANEGAVSDVLDGGPLVDPRFRIIAPLPRPTGGVSGEVPNRQYNDFEPTDVFVPTIDLVAVSADLSTITASCTYWVGRPSTGATYAPRPHAFRWSEAAGTEALDELPDAIQTVPIGMSADGTVVVGAAESVDGATHVYRWTGPTRPVEVNPPPGKRFVSYPTQGYSHERAARYVSADGKLFVAQAAPTSSPPNAYLDYVWFRWSEGAGWDRESSQRASILPMAAGGATLVDQSSAPSTDAGPARWASVLWPRAEGSIELGTLAGFDSCQSMLVSADGSTAFGLCSKWDSASGTWTSAQTFRWTRESGMVPWSIGVTMASARTLATTADGSVVAGVVYDSTVEPGAWRGFRWTAASGAVLTTGIQGNIDTALLSEDGRVTFGSASAEGERPQAFRLTQEGTITLPHPTGAESWADCANRDGSVLGGWMGNESEKDAVVWDDLGPRIVSAELAVLGVDLGGLRLTKVVEVGSGSPLVLIGTGTQSIDYSGFGPTATQRVWVARLPRR